MLVGLLYIYSLVRTLKEFLQHITFKEQCWLWLAFCIICFKVPMFPFHVWLPEAHVEAPTVGSVLLGNFIKTWCLWF
jgi:NADH-quinone oxidoreductase subunit M